MNFERYGQGERVYIGLHGWGNDRRVFAPLAAHVPAHASFYCADLPGCGNSAPPRVWSVEAVTSEVLETIRSLKAGRVTIVGHCGGAIFALFAALADEERVERVVAVDPFAYLPRYFRLFTGEGFGRRAYEATFANSFGRRATNFFLNAGRDSQTDMTASFSATDHLAARRYLSLFASLESAEIFRGVSASVDLVYGEKSFGAVRRSIGLFQKAMPHARPICLRGARHMPFAEATGGLARIIFAPGEATEDEVTNLRESRANDATQAEELNERKGAGARKERVGA